MTDTRNAIRRLSEYGQSIWLDNVSRKLISSGELQRLIDLGIKGLTSNPTIFEKALSNSSDYDESIVHHVGLGKSASEIFEELTIEDIGSVADALIPVYQATGRKDGFASLEVNPHLAHDTQGTVSEAVRLFSALNRPNVMIKVPATPEGIPAISQLIGEGINVNVTLIFSLKTYGHVRDAYLSGLETFSAIGGDVSKVSSVASFFVSRVDTAVDELITKAMKSGVSNLGALVSQAAIANARVAYKDFRRTFGQKQFTHFREKGAHVQRPLWASTSTKNPELSDVLYIEELIGSNTVNTLPDVTLEAFLDHGNIAETLSHSIDQSHDVLTAISDAGINMDDVTDQLLDAGVKAFATSYDEVVRNVNHKQVSLVPG